VIYSYGFAADFLLCPAHFDGEPSPKNLDQKKTATFLTARPNSANVGVSTAKRMMCSTQLSPRTNRLVIAAKTLAAEEKPWQTQEISVPPFRCSCQALELFGSPATC
jgi:hypothetical protein